MYIHWVGSKYNHMGPPAISVAEEGDTFGWTSFEITHEFKDGEWVAVDEDE